MLCTTIAISMALSGSVLGQEAGADKLTPSEARALIQQWVQTERMITEEKADWKIEREQLNDLIKLYETEMALLKDEVEKAGESHVELDKEKATLESEVKQMRADRRKLGLKVRDISKRMLEVSARFPKPLKDLLSADLYTLESVEDETQMRDGVVALANILKEAGRFNRAVYFSEEMQALEDGEKRQLQVLYLGLGRAYFVSGDKAGVGMPGADGWQWSIREGIDNRVKTTIRVFKKSSQAGLVKLPVEVKP
ncbi:DUF3450 family protein [Rubritalea squalenifaciens]|nr:DUF3450 family protein [Rubritalea squalenifaciens]